MKHGLLKSLSIAKVAIVTLTVLVTAVACGPGFKYKRSAFLDNARITGTADASGAEVLIRNVKKTAIREVQGNSYELTFSVADGSRTITDLKTYHYGGTSEFSAETTVGSRYTYTISAMCAPADCSEVVALISREDRESGTNRQNAFLIRDSADGMQLVQGTLGTNYLDLYQVWTVFTGNYE
ncbi:MAG: hypothetical protein NDI61_02810 [Bdellovibrionaceae bacterium]|nr:hypothetical protein [Pseudobdellovibrionaceae bacterium]